ncbi:flagellar assembly protein FliW [Deferribacteres bacterium DY0037]|nr:flagellar assembly protein FliW [Denitrovibrio acetiphilus]
MSTSSVKKCEAQMETRKIMSSKLGEIEFNEADIITLSAPILGFPELNDFVLISNEKSYPFIWFQSVQDANICFILVEPGIFFPDYKPEISKRDLKILSIEEEKDVKLFGIVVVPDQPKNATVNLRAPLVVNVERKLSKQVILEDDKWQIKSPLFKNQD